MIHHKKYLKSLIRKGGPAPEDYYDLDAWMIEVWEQAKTGIIGEAERKDLIGLLGDAVSVETMQGFTLQKPHGYAGDFEIIDRIYERYVSGETHLSNWDIYWQSHAAADAVRNRVHYLSRLITTKVDKTLPNRVLEVLNLASGPGRDMLFFFRNNLEIPVRFYCVEQDRRAIDHAKSLCHAYLEDIVFHAKNALRFKSDKTYDLIWSAGLFDYFSDTVFVFMLRKLAAMVSPGGEIVIGNFSTKNPSKPYMELFEWNLYHRSPSTLKALAEEAGFRPERMTVEREESGVNLFLRLRV